MTHIPAPAPLTVQGKYVDVEEIDGGAIVKIILNRPRYRNAQNRGLLMELDEAFGRAEQDDRVRVIILAGAGKTFSAGHDLGTPEHAAERDAGPDQHPSYVCHGGSQGGVEGIVRQEWHYFFENTRRWRNLRKITIAQVQGQVLSAGLMLMWACDLIVAGDDASFADVVGTRMGMCGVEYFAHPWEFGPRKTKELLLTGDSLSADAAYDLGMLARVYPTDDLDERTLAFARRVAEVPSMAALLIKDSVNQSMNAAGFNTALESGFALHQLNHAYWLEKSGGDVAYGTPEFGVVDWRAAGATIGSATKSGA